MAPSKQVTGRVITRVRATLSDYSLLQPGRRVLVAVSGGQDSLTLAEVLRRIQTSQPRWQSLALAHCDHRWPHDDGIAAHVARYARRVALRLHVVDAADDGEQMQLSENAARQWRYNSLTRLAQRHGYDDVVTGHTITDLAETVMFNLAHGAGADGLGSMTWSRALSADVALVRPMLNVSRSETEAFCEENDTEVWKDHYNEDRRYARNRIRAEVIPLMKTHLNTQVESALARTAHLLRDDSACLEEQAEQLFQEVVTVHHHGIHRGTHGDYVWDSSNSLNGALSDIEKLRLDTANATCYEGTENDSMLEQAPDQVKIILLNKKTLWQAHIAIQRRVIRMVLRRHLHLSHRSSTFPQVEAMCKLLQGQVGDSTASLSKHSFARVIDDSTVAIRFAPRMIAHSNINGNVKTSTLSKDSDSVIAPAQEGFAPAVSFSNS